MSLLARLIEAGTPPDLIEEVAMLVAEKRAAEKAIAERRAKDAERQQRKRDADAGHVTSRDDTLPGVTGEDCPLSRPPNENNSNPPTQTPGISIPRAKAPWPMPEFCLDPQHWVDLKANRKTKRLPNTPTAYAKFLRDLDQWTDAEWPPGRVLEAIAARGWASAEHDPRGTPSHDRPAQRPQHQRETTRQTGERVAARYAAAGGGTAQLLLGPGAPGWNARERG